MTIVSAFCACNLKAQDIYGDLYNGPGNTIVVRGDENLNVYGSIQNFGTILIVPTKSVWAQYEFQNSGLVEMLGGPCSSVQTFTNYATGIIKGCGSIGSSDNCIDNKGLIWSMGGSLILGSYSDDPKKVGISNTGTLRNSPGTSLTVIFWPSFVPDVNNQGTIEINADGAVVFDCNNLNNEHNAIIKLYGGTLAAKTVTQKDGAIFEGFGGVTGNVVIEPNATIKLTGPTNIVGDLKIDEGATLEISDGTTLITGQTTCNGTIHMKGGYIIPQGGLSGNCNIIWQPGTYTNPADFNLDGYVNLKDFAYFTDTWLWQTAWW
jgi:hypothetical protein